MPGSISRPRIAAIVLAAGLSTRMGGRPKPLLPFGDGTVVERILTVLAECPIHKVIAVTGHERQAVQAHLSRWQVRTVHNPDYASGEMLSSVQVGLQSISTEADAALIVLSDQPALERQVVTAVIAAFWDRLGSIIIPSFEMKRGHPILIGRKHWGAILELSEGQTLRDHMRTLGTEIYHVPVNTGSILRDMDTPDEYQRELAEYVARRGAERALPIKAL